MSNMPLKGIKVVEMGTLIAGPYCGHLLANFGAEVIKVEPPKMGDPMRVWGKATKEDRSLWWSVQSRNKKCVTLDLRKEEGQSIARKLIKEADILIENFRPGRMEGWNLGFKDLVEVNPKLIMVRITGFGQTGPYRDKTGFGSVGEAMGGLRYVTGYPDRPPSRIGISIGDSVAAMFGAIGALMALYNRDLNNGPGQEIDVALYESIFALMESSLIEYDKLGYLRERTGTVLPGIAPSNIYPTKDGKGIIIGANQDNIFKRLAELMEQPELGEDPKYATHVARGERQIELDEIVSNWTEQYDRDELNEMLDKAAVPAGPIYSIADIVNDVQYAARDMIREMEDPVWGKVKHPGIVPKLSETPGDIQWTGPGLGEHNHEIYGDLLGLPKQKIEELSSSGII